MKRVLPLVMAFMLLWPALGGKALDMAEIDAQVDKLFNRAKTVGGSLVIMKGDQLLYARDYGQRNRRHKLPVDENTYFRMGCVTKMVSSLAILQLVEEGKLALDQDISDYFGYAIVNPHFPDTPITLRQMLSHTTSISEGGGYSNYKNKVYDMLSRDVNRPGNFHKTAPGSKYKYSNFSSGLVGSLVEQVSGQSINRFVTERLFKPLNMDASLAASWLTSPDDIASIYKNGELIRAAGRYVSEGYDDSASPETHFRVLVGGLFIRSRDLALIASALCGDGSVKGIKFLKEETLQEMRAQQHALGKSVTGESPYGLFLARNTRALPGRVLYGHEGLTVGSSNAAYFEPETGYVFVMTTNGVNLARDHGHNILAQSLIRYTYPIFAGEAAKQ